jgi:hypothetical protein
VIGADQRWVVSDDEEEVQLPDAVLQLLLGDDNLEQFHERISVVIYIRIKITKRYKCKFVNIVFYFLLNPRFLIITIE